MRQLARSLPLLTLLLAVSACGGGSGGGEQAAGQAAYYVVTMIDGWAPRVPETALQTRKDGIARYDQVERKIRGLLEEFLKRIELGDLAPQIDDVLCAVDIAFSVPLLPEQVLQLEGHPDVEGVDEDLEFVFTPLDVRVNTTPNLQIVDVGVQRVGEGGGTPIGWAWVLDSGVDLDHPDLNVQVDACRSMFRTGSRASQKNDFHGHGTHVSGIIGAIDNNIGTKGVAPGAQIVGVKVLASNGRGNYRKVLKGMDYVAGNAWPGDVANMSFHVPVNTSRRKDKIRRAVWNIAGRGVHVTISAGNDYRDIDGRFPANIQGNRIYTVSALDARTDEFWKTDDDTGSNFGRGVDCCAPGVDVLSLAPDGGTTWMTGTSMAAPHVAGILLLTGGGFNTDGFVTGDPDGRPDPIAIR